MARFPKIDSPCPLNVDEQLRIDGYCGRCEKHVHALDAMSDGERVALLQAAKGSLCVSYRTPQRRAAGFGVAIAATLVATSAFAGDGQHPTTQPPLASGQQAQATAIPVQESPLISEADKLELIMVGGISDPNDAAWTDDDTRPELPIAPEPAATELVLDQVFVTGGGITDPSNVEWIDDSALPELPMQMEPRAVASESATADGKVAGRIRLNESN